MANDIFDQDAVLRKAIEAVGRTAEKKANHPHYPPSDEPLGWDTSGLVRLDVLVMAMHLMTFRICTRSIPGQIRQRVQRYKQGAIDSVSFWLLKTAIKDVLGGLVKWFKVAFDCWKLDELEAEKEKAIRRASIIAMRDVYRNKMKPANKRERRVRWVHSRHNTKRQRKANKRWTKSNKQSQNFKI